MATIILPQSGNADEKIEHECQSMVLVGANGSGKTRLGIWIENEHPHAHRIGAQRSLVFTEQITPRSTKVAKTFLLYGSYNERPDLDEEFVIERAREQKLNSRWGRRPESHLLNDFDHVLSLLVALYQRRNEQFTEDYKANKISSGEDVPKSALDQTLAVWHKVMPHRKLELSDNRLTARRIDSDENYSGLSMSDGERVAFYLTAQAMCAPAQSLIIVDEPEVHLHKAIEATLWDAIEAERSDCTFLYITHDLEFAASRSGTDTIWVQEFDGKNWTWQLVGDVEGFPTDLTLEILGSRKPVLFVEGTRDSIDTLLYRRIYSDFHVIAREGCAKVIESTVALRQAGGFHSTNATGVIDRDFRADEVLEGLEKDGVFTTPVAEAENAICLPCIVRAAAKHFKRDEADILDKATSAAFEFLDHQLDHQIKQRASQEIRHALSQFSSKGISNREDFEQAVVEFKEKVDAGTFYDDAKQKFQTVRNDKDYLGLLRLFNNKGLEDKVAKAIGFSDGKTFREWVIAEIDDSLTSESPSEIGSEILAGLQQIFPVIPTPTEVSARQPSTLVSSREQVGDA